jgi:hypothetical protein
VRRDLASSSLLAPIIVAVAVELGLCEMEEGSAMREFHPVKQPSGAVVIIGHVATHEASGE